MPEPSTDKLGIIAPRPATAAETDGLAGAAQLVVLVHPDSRRLGQRFWIEPGRTLEVGRSARAALSFDDVLSVSREHARLRHDADAVTLEDLGSTNGTFVNDQMVRGPLGLRHGDRVQTGGIHFRFLRSTSPETAYQRAVHEIVARDGLTGLLQRATFLEEAARETARAERHGRALSLGVIELLDFERMDRDFGRLCGDFVLRRLALLQSEDLGPAEGLGRTGPTEFARLLPETDLGAAWTRLLTFAARVEAAGFECASLTVPVRVSVGVASHAPGVDADRLLAAARRAALERRASTSGGAESG